MENKAELPSFVYLQTLQNSQNISNSGDYDFVFYRFYKVLKKPPKRINVNRGFKNSRLNVNSDQSKTEEDNVKLIRKLVESKENKEYYLVNTFTYL